MNSTEIKETMKKVHGELKALESKLEGADEAKKAVVAEMIEGKTKEFDTLKADLAHAEKREQIEREIAEMDEKRNETEGKTKQIQDVEIEAKSEHNQTSETVAHTQFFNDYITCQGKVSDMLNHKAREKGDLYVEGKMIGNGAKMPDWLGKAIMPKPVSAQFEEAMVEAAIEGKRLEGKTPVYVREASGTNSGGGSLVPELFDTTLFKVPKRTSQIVDRCYVKRGVGKEMQFPKLTQSTNEFGVAVSLGNEGAAITQSDPTFTRIDCNLIRLATLNQVSMRELRENQIGYEGELVWMIQGAMGRAIDSIILNGSAVSGAPEGINTNVGAAAGVVEVARETAAQVSYTDLVRMQFDVDDGIFGTGVYVLSGGSTGSMRYCAALDDSNGRPIFGGDSQSGWGTGSAPSLAGAPYISTVSHKDFDSGTVKTVGDAGSVIYGNFMGYGFCWDSQAGVSIERSDEYAFNTGNVTFRSIVYIGGKILGGNMFSILDDASGASSSSSSSS
jgi:HK97 family phage major capsid protein